MKTVIIYQSSQSQNSVEVFVSLEDAMTFAENSFSRLVSEQLEYKLKPVGKGPMIGGFYGYDKERGISFSFITREIKS